MKLHHIFQGKFTTSEPEVSQVVDLSISSFVGDKEHNDRGNTHVIESTKERSSKHENLESSQPQVQRPPRYIVKSAQYKDENFVIVNFLILVN